ncbi:MAG TPA: hypothetical protein VEA37_07185, partial [Flavobacterium sp.]|nr:hypothetical protein [Flavobacterium sp.]
MAYLTRTYRDFSGLNDTASLDSLLESELVTAQNIIFDNRGGYSKGWGRVRHTATPLTASPMKRVIALYRKDGTVKKFYAAGNTVWVDNDNGTYTALVDGAGAQVTFANTNFDSFTWTEDRLYLINGDRYYKVSFTNSRWEAVEVTPATNADLTGVKRCNMHEYYTGWFRHFFAGDTTDKMAVWYSEDNDPANVRSGTSGTAKVHPNPGLGPVTGLKTHRNAVLVGYKRGWMKWEGGGTQPAISADWHQLKASSGPTSNRAITPVREVLSYTATDGVYLLESLNTSAEDNSRKISKDIDNLYKSLTNKDNLVSVFDGRWLYIGGSDNKVLVADFDIIDEDGNPAWTVFTE